MNFNQKLIFSQKVFGFPKPIPIIKQDQLETLICHSHSSESFRHKVFNSLCYEFFCSHRVYFFKVLDSNDCSIDFRLTFPSLEKFSTAMNEFLLAPFSIIIMREKGQKDQPCRPAVTRSRHCKKRPLHLSVHHQMFGSILQQQKCRLSTHPYHRCKYLLEACFSRFPSWNQAQYGALDANTLKVQK